MPVRVGIFSRVCAWSGPGQPSGSKDVQCCGMGAKRSPRQCLLTDMGWTSPEGLLRREKCPCWLARCHVHWARGTQTATEGLQPVQGQAVRAGERCPRGTARLEDPARDASQPVSFPAGGDFACLS